MAQKQECLYMFQSKLLNYTVNRGGDCFTQEQSIGTGEGKKQQKQEEIATLNRGKRWFCALFLFALKLNAMASSLDIHAQCQIWKKMYSSSSSKIKNFCQLLTALIAIWMSYQDF